VRIGTLIQERLAFTASFWGNGAVVCRAIEDSPGPVVDQEFGPFETWTQAQDFARQLNEGLELQPAEARQIVTSSVLGSTELFHNFESPGNVGDPQPPLVSGKQLRVQFVIAELDLAITFCRIARSKPSALAERLRRSARNALFKAMHYLCQPELTACEVTQIRAAMQRLQKAFQKSFSAREDLVAAASESWVGFR
jgi:hypothetical protein